METVRFTECLPAACALLMGSPSRPKARPPQGLPDPSTKRSKRWIGGHPREALNKENFFLQPMPQQDESSQVVSQENRISEYELGASNLSLSVSVNLRLV